MTEIDKIRELKLNALQNGMQMREIQDEQYKFFEFDDMQQGDMLTVNGGKSDWTETLTTEYNKLGLRPYTWTEINGVDDAVKKSENNLIDLIRYYEGHGDNYTAKTNYKDTVNVTTYGYGLTATSMKAIGNYQNGKVINKPTTQAKAYEQLLKYLTDVTLPETKRYLGDVKYDELPQGVKAALLDYHFKNGYAIMNKSSLKSKLQETRKTNTPENWIAFLKELVYTKPASSKAEKVDNPGLYRRSLSRVIIAAKDLKNYFPSPKDRAMIDKTVKEIYEAGIKCAKNNGIGTTDFDRIYNSYIEKTEPSANPTSKPEANDKGTKKYVVPSQMSLFSTANAIIPDKVAEKNGIDSKELRIAVIDEIIRLNNIQSDGVDNNGYPKVRLLEQGEQLVMPASVKIGGKTVTLQAPKNWDVISGKPQTPQTVNSDEEPEAGTYIVKQGDSWWSIARDVATGDYTDHQINTLQQQIADYNNNVDLKEGMVIKLPPENYVDPSEGESGERETEESNLANLLKNLKSNSVKVGNSDIEEVTFEYTLEKGDTIYRIALNYGIDYKELLSDNNIKEKDASNLDVGAKIKIKKFAYTASKDESIESIATQYGLPKELLQSVNGNITTVKKGEKIEIPGTLYVAKNKDTWAKIAENNSVSAEQLQKINGKKLNKGQKVFIPQSISSYEKINTDMPATAVKSSVQANVEKSLKNAGDRKYLKKEYVRYESGKVIAMRVEFKPEFGNTPANKINKTNFPLLDKTIIVNAGHGLKPTGELDPGNTASGRHNIPNEWLAAYDNAMRLKDRLCAKGAKVIFIQGEETPDALVSNEIRKKENKADLFISLHTNSSPSAPKKDRAEIYCHRNSSASPRLAEIFESKLDDYQNNKDYAQTKKCGYQVLRVAKENNTPGILWEIAFHNNNDGRAKLADNTLMDKYSDMLTASVVEYFNIPADTRHRYTVKKGDNLGKIAEKHHTTVKKLQELNGLKGTSIREGQKLVVSDNSGNTGKTVSSNSATKTTQSSNNSYVTYKVKKDDSLISIAKNQGVTVDQIKKLNGLKNNNIQVGQTLKIKKK